MFIHELHTLFFLKMTTFKLLCKPGTTERHFVQVNKRGKIVLDSNGNPITMNDVLGVTDHSNVNSRDQNDISHDLSRYGIYFNDTDSYDYMQHLRPITGQSGSVFVPSKVTPSIQEQDESLSSEYDDLLEALDNDEYLILEEGNDVSQLLSNLSFKSTTDAIQRRQIDDEFDRIYTQGYESIDDYYTDINESPIDHISHFIQTDSSIQNEPEIKKGVAALDEIRSTLSGFSIPLSYPSDEEDQKIIKHKTIRVHKVKRNIVPRIIKER